MYWNISRVAVVLVFIMCFSAQAHRPIFTKEKGMDPESAVKVAEPQVSQVIYRELVDKRPQLWLSFDAEKDFKLFVQLGIPVIDRLKSFRPSFVVVGPDLPDISLPFAIPEGLGGVGFSTADVKEPRFFHEHFTKTDSWILRGETVTLPSKGRYYVIAYSPSNERGKLWLSVGKKEKFGLMDWLRFGEWKRRIQAFHEVGMAKSMIIDDFSDPNHISRLGTKWRLVTDRVMGGISEAKSTFGQDESFKYIHVQGNVSLENNGGFVQMALALSDNSESLDVKGYSGVRLWVKGNGQRYYVHLKNKQTILHWQYYAASFTTSERWEQIEIPFEQFEPQALEDELRLDDLTRIAIVGAKKAYPVDIYVGPIEFYGKKLEKKKAK